MKRSHILSKKLLNVFVPVFIVIAMITTYKVIASKSPANKAELAYVEHSPLGTKGGSVMPASCDSYPSHSRCVCEIGQTQTYPCSVANGGGTRVERCVVSGDNLLWSAGNCPITSCNPGYDLVADYYGTRCQANCAGNGYRTYKTQNIMTGCAQWCPNGMTCDINKEEDKTFFANYSIIERAHAAYGQYCVDPIYQDVQIAQCSACPNGTVPNANHTACVAPAVPSVNVNLGQ